ncbi:hypothetical protein HOP50_16g76600 [Chloropicon primus]|uniref:Uncharacterized protein n=2 Tax=Chloropicon primus TaxID=1764295 RepID=A0A5B8MX33_9CHLO|nr:hypothetical protein A3770_16p76310 [Chloropicon primus]UPR04322.1 hypothetical protein HOP50_16g76600 [Chloropicon primus]|eukprot:QDZ25113.1 hypothetical protein A3770_16p76310 [Chloropicon primus]
MVELASHEEFSKVTDSLHKAVDQALRSASLSDWSENERHSIRSRLFQMTDNVLHKLRLGVDCSGLGDHIVNKNGELVLYSGESYNKIHQEEIENLEQKANSLAKELEECRQAVPQKILQQLKTQLDAVRPDCELKISAQEENRETKRARVDPSAKDNAEGLKDKLSFASQKMPEIRAKIEEAVARTDRVIRAMEYQAAASKSDGEGEDIGNLQKLLGEGGEDGTESGGTDGVSPAIKEAEATGHVSVRKKWAKLMSFSSPMKFSLKDAR